MMFYLGKERKQAGKGGEGRKKRREEEAKHASMNQEPASQEAPYSRPNSIPPNSCPPSASDSGLIWKQGLSKGN